MTERGLLQAGEVGTPQGNTDMAERLKVAPRQTVPVEPTAKAEALPRPKVAKTDLGYPSYSPVR